MPYLYAVKMLIPNLDAQPIKVGFSTNPNNRMRHYDSGPYPCEWLGVWPGTIDDERAFHAKFKEIRLTGEWFAPNEEFLKSIKENIKRHQEELSGPAFMAYRERLRSEAMRVLESHDFRPEAA
jgi:Meiotically Up-regulated Gene 113 (MUG113) protein